ncbi:MAG: DnaJ domain-containing protein [Mariniblastus sp.]|nr:DnaJ domain-containing protein [Mariniblastus sp.]
MALRTFYEILGIPHDADDDEIRRAYRRVMQEHHPDQNPDDRKAARRTRHLNAARDALLDPAKRRKYDRKLRRKGLIPKRPKRDRHEATHPPDHVEERTDNAGVDNETTDPPEESATGAEASPADPVDRWKRHRSRPSQWIPKPHFQAGHQGHWKLWVALLGLLLLTGGLVLSVYLFDLGPGPDLRVDPAAEKPDPTEPKSSPADRVLPPPLASQPSNASAAPEPGNPPAATDLAQPSSSERSSDKGETIAKPTEVTKRKPTGPVPAPLISPFEPPEAEQRQQQWADWLNLPSRDMNDIGMEWILLPSGRFLSGFPEQAKIEQSWLQVPALQTIERPFYLARQPVTRKSWFEVMGTEPWKDQEDVSSIPDDHPYATGMDWQEAVDFCQELSQRDGHTYRLPSQLEWEFAWQSGRPTSFFLPDSTWDAPAAIDASAGAGFGLTFAPFLWEFCDDFFDETRHIARRPVEFHSSRLGRQLGRGTAVASPSRGFRVVKVPAAITELQEFQVSNSAVDPSLAWKPPTSVPDVPALFAPWIRPTDAQRPALIPGQKGRVKALTTLQAEIRSQGLASTEGATGAASMNRLGMQLLQSTRREPVGPRLYARLDRAIHYLTLSGNPTLTDHGIDLLCEKFQVDPLSMHIWAARNWHRLIDANWVTDRDAKRKSLAVRVRRLGERAGELHRYHDQVGLLQLYLELLPDNHKQIGPTETLLNGARQRSQQHLQMLHLQETLVQQPDRSQASRLGEYFCFELNEWDRGVPYLAQGQEGPLQQVAQYEMRNHESADARLWIADGWWKLSENRSENRGPLRERAGQWYHSAYPDLQGEERERVARRLQELYAQPIEWNLSFQHGALPERIIQRGKTARRKTGLLLYPGSAIALDQVFSSIDSVSIRGRIGSFQTAGRQNFHFQVGPVHATFNSEQNRANYFRTLPPAPNPDEKRPTSEATAPHALQPGQFHDLKITRTEPGELRLTVDGKTTYRTSAEFQGGLMIFSGNDPIEIESLSIRGIPDPLAAPHFMKRFNLDTVGPKRW